VEGFKQKIKDGINKEVMQDLVNALRPELKTAGLTDIEFVDNQFLGTIPEAASPEDEAKKWNSAKTTVENFLKNRVMVKPQKQTGVKDSVDFFKLFSESKTENEQQLPIEVFIGKLLKHPEFKGENADKQESANPEKAK